MYPVWALNFLCSTGWVQTHSSCLGFLDVHDPVFERTGVSGKWLSG